jgi:hypothetical protein
MMQGHMLQGRMVHNGMGDQKGDMVNLNKKDHLLQGEKAAR